MTENFKILRYKQLKFLIPLSRCTLWRRVKAGTFPAPINLGSRRATGWRESDIINWIENQQLKSSLKTSLESNSHVI